MSVLVYRNVHGTIGTSTDLLLDDILVDYVVWPAICSVLCIFRLGIEGLLDLSMYRWSPLVMPDGTLELCLSCRC